MAALSKVITAVLQQMLALINCGCQPIQVDLCSDGCCCCCCQQAAGTSTDVYDLVMSLRQSVVGLREVICSFQFTANVHSQAANIASLRAEVAYSQYYSQPSVLLSGSLCDCIMYHAIIK